MNELNSATSVWKTFDENVVTHSSAHHLLAIRELLQRYGYARVTDVAKHLGITRGSVSVTLKSLKEKGYTAEDDHKFLRLTRSGEQIVQTIEANREVLQKFFRDVLAVNHEQAEIDACKLEHLLSSEIGKRLLDFLDFLFSEDHRAAAFLAAFQSINSNITKPDDEIR